jgi:hypothetical protein
MPQFRDTRQTVLHLRQKQRRAAGHDPAAPRTGELRPGAGFVQLPGERHGQENRIPDQPLGQAAGPF